MKFQWRVVVAVILTAVIVSVAWYAALPSIMQPQVVQKPTKLEQITFLLDFVPQGKYVPLYAALGNGYYEQGGIAPTFISGSGSSFAISQVDAGKVDLGMADIPTIILAQAKGANIKMVMLLIDKSMSGIASWKELKTPKDLEGMTYGGPSFSSLRVLVPLVMSANGADPSKLKFVNADPAVYIQSFIAGQYNATDGLWGGSWVVIQGEAQKAGKKVFFKSITDWGLDLYGYAVIANTKFIQDKPELIRNFIRATIKGIDFSVSTPDQATDMMIKYQPAISKQIALRQWQQTIDLVKTPLATQKGYGVFDPTKMQNNLKVIVDAYHTGSNLQPSDLYTSQFVPTR